MKLDTRSVLDSLQDYLQERPSPGTLRPLQRAVLGKGEASFKRNGHWPIIDFPLALHADLEGSARIGAVIAGACALFYAFADVTDDAQDHALSHEPWQDWGWEQAVNTGSSLLFQSLQYLYDELPRELAPSVVEAFVRAGLEMTYGQHLDLRGSEVSGAPLASYLAMARQKSGASFGAYAAAVAIGNRLPEAAIAMYREFGETLGGMFQMMSDVYELWGNGPSPDFLNRRLSFPLALALEQASGPTRSQILALLDGPTDGQAQETFAQLLETSGIKTYATLRIEVYRRRARELAQSLGPLRHPYLSMLIEHPVFPPAPRPDH